MSYKDGFKDGFKSGWEECLCAVIDILSKEDIEGDPDDLYSGRQHRIEAMKILQPETDSSYGK